MGLKAVSKGKFKTTIVAPEDATKEELDKKAKKYIKGEYDII
ncbi:MAG: hypothetical protein ACTSUK_06880 [Promethearchaeota archaeon]